MGSAAPVFMATDPVRAMPTISANPEPRWQPPSHPLPMWHPRRAATADQQTQQALALSTNYQRLKPTRQPPSGHDSRHDGYAHVGMVCTDIRFPDSGPANYLHEKNRVDIDSIVGSKFPFQYIDNFDLFNSRFVMDNTMASNTFGLILAEHIWPRRLKDRVQREKFHMKMIEYLTSTWPEAYIIVVCRGGRRASPLEKYVPSVGFKTRTAFTLPVTKHYTPRCQGIDVANIEGCDEDLALVIYPKSYRKRAGPLAPVVELDFKNKVHILEAVLRVAYQGFRTLQLGAHTLDSSLAIAEHWLTYCT